MTYARLIAAAALIAASTTLQAAPQAVADPTAPGSHFALATEAFARKEYARAAREIRKGSAFVEQQAGRALGGAGKELHSAAMDLKVLAGKVQKGTVKDAAALDAAFSKAKQAIEASRRDAPIPGDKSFTSGGDRG